MSSMQPLPPRREAGVTLIEALVVLAILGLVTAIVAVPMNSYWQRSRLQSAAGDIRTFIQKAYLMAVSQHASVTISLVVDNSGGSPVTMLQLNPPPPGAQADWLALYGTYLVPDFVSLAYNPAGNAGGWPTAQNPTGGSGLVRAIVCSESAQTLIPATTDCSSACKSGEVAGGQTLEVKTLTITHTRMVDGSLRPDTRFNIQVFPIWNVSYQKVVQ